MNYVITGSLGRISKPVIKRLVAAGHSVTVITRKPTMRKHIKALGAETTIGFVENEKRTKGAFARADAVLLLMPLGYPSKKSWYDYQVEVTDSYVNALRNTGVKYAVFVSTIGAHIAKRPSYIDGLSYTEWHLSQVKDLNLRILRPSYLYNNLMNMVPLVKNTNVFGANFAGDKEKLVLTHISDIVDVVVRDLTSLNFRNKTIRNIASDERYPSEIAKVLGKAIRKPLAPWVEFADDDLFTGMVQSGIRPETAKGIVGLGADLKAGILQADYWNSRPPLGKIKLEEFAKEFATAFRSAYSADKYF